MPRVVGVGDQAVALEQVGDPLDALACQPEGAGDVRDGPGSVFRSCEDLPSGAGLARRAGKAIAGRAELAMEADHQDRKLAESITSGRPRGRRIPG